MEKKTEIDRFVQRHLSQLKVLTRLMEHEIDLSKDAAEVTFDRDLTENMLDTIEIFIEDVEGSEPKAARKGRAQAESKPAVTRLN
ncbi:MAG: hypothetical protein ACYTG5_18505 [Planctomycetota bacterium]|jgi:hypothetical protein